MDLLWHYMANAAMVALRRAYRRAFANDQDATNLAQVLFGPCCSSGKEGEGGDDALKGDDGGGCRRSNEAWVLLMIGTIPQEGR